VDDLDASECEGYPKVGDVESSVNWCSAAPTQHEPGLIALVRWIQTFSFHFLAKRALEKYSVTFPGVSFAFPIIVVDPPKWTKPPTWLDVKVIITEAMTWGGYKSEVSPEDIIDKLGTRN